MRARMTLIPGMIPNLNDILGVRDSLGATLKPVKIVSWTWSGADIGVGTKVELAVDVTPGPRIVEFSADSKVLQGGAVKAGDIMLKMVSKQTFPTVDLVDCVALAPSVERFYSVGGIQYQVIGITEKHLTWNIHLRRRSHQG